jgi:hypothetical protein
MMPPSVGQALQMAFVPPRRPSGATKGVLGRLGVLRLKMESEELISGTSDKASGIANEAIGRAKQRGGHVAGFDSLITEGRGAGSICSNSDPTIAGRSRAA